MSVPQSATGDERRIAPRFQPAFGTICRFRPRSENPDPDHPVEQSVGLVWNISESGVSMLLSVPPERGTQLDAELRTDSGAVVSIGITVVHIREMPTGDFFIGAQFDRHLAGDELQRFLLPKPRTGKADKPSVS